MTSASCPNNDPKVEVSQCQASSEKKETEKRETAKGKETVAVGSVPTYSGKLNELSQAKASSSLCMVDDQCESGFCESTNEVRKAIENQFPEASTKQTILGKVNNGIGDLTLAQKVITGDQTFESGDKVSGICREQTEPFDFNTFFKDNQSTILIGVAVLLGLMILPSLLRNK